MLADAPRCSLGDAGRGLEAGQKQAEPGKSRVGPKTLYSDGLAGQKHCILQRFEAVVRSGARMLADQKLRPLECSGTIVGPKQQKAKIY